jgi:hypothetical protein
LGLAAVLKQFSFGLTLKKGGAGVSGQQFDTRKNYD